MAAYARGVFVPVSGRGPVARHEEDRRPGGLQACVERASPVERPVAPSVGSVSPVLSASPSVEHELLRDDVAIEGQFEDAEDQGGEAARGGAASGAPEPSRPRTPPVEPVSGGGHDWSPEAPQYRGRERTPPVSSIRGPFMGRLQFFTSQPMDVVWDIERGHISMSRMEHGKYHII